MLLPTVTSIEEYRPHYGNDETWLPALRAICRRHGLDPDDLRRQPLGSQIVFRSGARIVKLFCPLWPRSYVCEAAALAAVRGHGLATPEPTDHGELAGWPDLIMTIVPGVPAVDVWNQLDSAARERVVARIGELLAALHRISRLRVHCAAGVLRARHAGARAVPGRGVRPRADAGAHRPAHELLSAARIRTHRAVPRPRAVRDAAGPRTRDVGRHPCLIRPES